MSADPGMDLEEDLFSSTSENALHEYSWRTSFVEFVTEHDEGLGTSSDSSGFSSFRWENLLEEVGEQWCLPVSLIECQYGDVRG